MTSPEQTPIEDPAWRARVPEFIARCISKWSLELGEALEGGYLAAVHGRRLARSPTTISP